MLLRATERLPWPVRPWTSPGSTLVAHGEGGPPSVAVCARVLGTRGGRVLKVPLGYGGPSSSPVTGNKGSPRPQAPQG